MHILYLYECELRGSAILQALNNWALVLQELATLQSPAEQASHVQHSIFRFRQAIRLRPDFDRACYNLGTVYYTFACSQQSSVTQRLPSRVTQAREQKPQALYILQEGMQQAIASMLHPEVKAGHTI